MHTWQLTTSRYFFSLMLWMHFFFAIELLPYFYRGYWGYSCLLIILLVFQYRYLSSYQIVEIEYLAGRWSFVNRFGEQMTCKKVKLFSSSTYALILLLVLESNKKRIVVVFSDQYSHENQHRLRWMLLN